MMLVQPNKTGEIMVCIDAHALQRAQKTCAKETWIDALFSRATKIWKQRNHPPVPPKNPRIARDIGLSEAGQARMAHQWPSQTTSHPRM